MLQRNGLTATGNPCMTTQPFFCLQFLSLAIKAENRAAR